MWEAAAIALAFGLVFVGCLFLCFRFAYNEAFKIIMAAFAKAQSEYREEQDRQPLPHVNENHWDGADSVDELIRTQKGSAHPVPDIPPAPSDFAVRRDPTNFAANLKTERAKRGRG